MISAVPITYLLVTLNDINKHAVTKTAEKLVDVSQVDQQNRHWSPVQGHHMEVLLLDA